MTVPTISKPRPRAWPKWVGILLSVTWLSVVTGYVITNWGHVNGLDANALGDFAAGASAPLAFLWLVLGFFQQGEELRNSADALWLQGEELRNSVEQQRDLVDVSRQQLEFERKKIADEKREIDEQSRPVLRIGFAGSTHSENGKRLFFFDLFNSGPTCTDVRVIRNEGSVLASVMTLSNDSAFRFEIRYPLEDGLMDEVAVQFRDARYRVGIEEFILTQSNGEFRVDRYLDGYEGGMDESS